MVIFNSFLYVYQAGDPIVQAKWFQLDRSIFTWRPRRPMQLGKTDQNGGNGEFSMAQSK